MIKLKLESLCRVCNNKLSPLLTYNNMPKAAQKFPDKKSLNLDKGIDLIICQCNGCGLVQLDNEPVDYYKEVIRAAGFSKEMKKFRYQQFNDIIEKYNLNYKNIIEIGCGNGDYLSILNKFDLNVYGIEYSKESVKECQNKGLKVVRKYLDNANSIISSIKFDAFFIFSFFEHIPNPNLTLEVLKNNTAEDAIGVIEVPNFDMMLKNDLFSEFISDHLFYFTKETLTSTLNQNGFEVIECNEVWHDYIISAVIRKKKKLNLTHFKEYQKKISIEINQFIKQHNNVAIWGASHQGISIMAMAKLNNKKIKYVVDDATFKQEKYTHSTHIPIVSSSKLHTDPVDAIIVMAASYSDEVVKKIKDNFNKNIKISVLRDTFLEVL